MKVKRDDIVTVNYNSWSRVLSRDTSDKVASCSHGKIRTFKVLVTNCKLPIFDSDWVANTLIRAEDNADVVAINDCNLDLSTVGVGIQYIAQGKNVTAELSEQSKYAILRAHLGSM